MPREAYDVSLIANPIPKRVRDIVFFEKRFELIGVDSRETLHQRVQETATAPQPCEEAIAAAQRRREFGRIDRRDRQIPFVFSATEQRFDALAKIVAVDDQIAFRSQTSRKRAPVGWSSFIAQDNAPRRRSRSTSTQRRRDAFESSEHPGEELHPDTLWNHQ